MLHKSSHKGLGYRFLNWGHQKGTKDNEILCARELTIQKCKTWKKLLKNDKKDIPNLDS